MYNGESEKIEYKSSFAQWREIIISLCAFANKNGGKVIVGLDDKGESAKLTIGKGTIEDFVNKVKLNTDPVLYPSVNTLTYGLNDIIEIEIKKSDNKPVFAFDKAYTRIGKTNQKISNQELKDIIRRYTIIDFDANPLAEKLANIKFDDELVSEVDKAYYKLGTKDSLEFLKKTGLVKNSFRSGFLIADWKS